MREERGDKERTNLEKMSFAACDKSTERFFMPLFGAAGRTTAARGHNQIVFGFLKLGSSRTRWFRFGCEGEKKSRRWSKTCR